MQSVIWCLNHNCCCSARSACFCCCCCCCCCCFAESFSVLFFLSFFWALISFVLFCLRFRLFACQTEKIDRFADVDCRSHLETNCSFRQFMRDAWVVMVVLVLQLSGLMCVQRHIERERKKQREKSLLMN